MSGEMTMEKFKIIMWPLVTLFILMVTITFNYTASFGLNSDLGVGDVSDKYSLEITPSGWTFSIWAFIYIWQFLWIGHVLFLTIKYEMIKIIFGKYFFFSFNTANIFNVLWIVLWVNEHIVWSMLFLIAMTMALITSAFIAHQYMHRVAWTVVDANYGSMVDGNSNVGSMVNSNNSSNPGITVTTDMTEGLPIRQWLNKSTSIRLMLYAFVLNGIPFYATWCVVASHLNIGVVIVYEGGMDDTTASFLMLSVLTCCILFYWFLDLYRLRFYLQYTFSPYFVLIVAFSGIFSNGDFDQLGDRPTWLFAAILLVVSVVGMVVKECLGMGMRWQKAAALQGV